MKYFRTKLRYKEIEEDTLKIKSASLLIGAINFAEAEEKSIEYYFNDIAFAIENKGVEVVSIKTEKVHEILLPAGDFIFKAKVECFIVDENGKEKKDKVIFFVRASDIENAKEHISDVMGENKLNWKLVSIEQTDIIEIIK